MSRRYATHTVRARAAHLLAVVAVVAVGLLATATSALAAGPAWMVSSSHFPTNLQPGKTVYYVVLPTNIGTTASVGTATLAYTLPAGVTATAATGTGWTCPGAAGQNVVTCTSLLAVPAAQPGNGVTIAATVPAGASGTLTGSVSISGGGAAAGASDTDTASIGGPASFGIAKFTARAYDETGRDVTQAGGHPWMATTQIALNTVAVPSPDVGAMNVEDARNITVDLPPGFVGNPLAAPRCPITLHSINGIISSCPANAIIGRVTLITANGGQMPTTTLPVSVPIYNLVPEGGQAGEFGFTVGGAPQIIYAGVRSDGNYQLSMKSNKIPVSVGQAVINLSLYGQPGAFNGTGSTAPFLTNPTDCSTTPVTKLTVDSWYRPDAPAVSTSYESPALTGCDRLAFAPSVSVSPDNARADAPAGYTVHIGIPQSGDDDPVASPYLRDAKVTLPAGTILNAGIADGLAGCTDEQFGEHTGLPAACPDASKVGSIELTTPLLGHPLPGSIHLRQPDPGATRENGLYTIFLDIEDSKSGVIVKLRGRVVPDEKTGQLTTTFTDNPQLPFSDMKLTFKGGGRAALANPQTCQANTTEALLSSWGGPAASPLSTFETSWDGQGAACPAVLPFSPALVAGTVDNAAGTSSPLTFTIGRDDRNDIVDGLTATLPTGLLASVRDVALCADADADAGTCPATSRIGTATVAAGSGPNPYHLQGTVSLTGPYRGGPYGLAIAVHAVAGPLDLGWVIVRQSIRVDPDDAHITVISDPIPTIQQGAPFRLRTIAVTIDRPGFMRTPTSCDAKAIGAAVHSAGGQVASLAVPFGARACTALPLAPKLALRLTDPSQTKDGGHPGVLAVLTQQPGESNLRSTSVTLPLSLALDPDNANGLCEYEAGLRGDCPASSIVGTADAISPLLKAPLTGNVYFVKGVRFNAQGTPVRTYPTLLIQLRGEIALDLRARTDVDAQNRLVTTFPAIPDAQISAFALSITGGAHGIIAVTHGQNVCKSTDGNAFMIDIGHNEKRQDTPIPVTPTCNLTIARTFTKTSLHALITGIGPGTITISGTGIKTTRRTIKAATSATLIAKLTPTGRRLRKAHRDIRVKATYRPANTNQTLTAHSAKPTARRRAAKR